MKIVPVEERFYIKNGSNIDSKEKKSIANKYIDILQKEKQAAFDMNETLKTTNNEKDIIIANGAPERSVLRS